MNTERLAALFAKFPKQTILVVGDYFLDQYLVIEHSLGEVSIETGLEAHQVVEICSSPGAAGTVTNNLVAMGVNVLALGVIGQDGRGFDLTQALQRNGVDTGAMIERAFCFTPTYTKPMLREADGSMRELNRLDVKNRQPMPVDIEDEVISLLDGMIDRVDGVIVADQVQERNCGVITDRVREAIAALAARNPGKIIGADSRERIGLFHNVIVKPNAREATRVIRPELTSELDRATLEDVGHKLFERNGKPAFVTMGGEGIMAFHKAGMDCVAAPPIRGPIDIVGAGDSAMSGIITALCAGASPAEAALVGNLAASVTIHQVGTTGVASCEDMLKVAGSLA
jgi:rfaE bifunctional protein kinase chain/domain